MDDDLNILMDHDFEVLDNYFIPPPMEELWTVFSASEDSIAPLNDYIGDPDGSGHIHQTTSITCAVVSQQMILNDFGILSPDTGQPPSEAELTYVAAVNGWLHNGTSPEDAGRLLEYYGVGNHHGYGIDNLVEELKQGHKVIVGVDSDELWNSENTLYNEMKEWLVGEGANHAIVIKGIITDAHSEPIIVVNDPGRLDGAGNQYPLSVFLDAFQDGNCHYVATDHAPSVLAENIDFGHNFDWENGRYLNSAQWWPGGYERPSLSESGLHSLTEDNPTIETMDEAQRLRLFEYI